MPLWTAPNLTMADMYALAQIESIDWDAIPVTQSFREVVAHNRRAAETAKPLFVTASNASRPKRKQVVT